MKTRLRILILFTAMCYWPEVFAQNQQDRLRKFLKEELEYNMKELQKQENPPYYMNFRLSDEKAVIISSSFGVLMHSDEKHQRLLVPQIRIGDTLLDNFKYNSMGIYPMRRDSYGGAVLPYDDGCEAGMRQAVWREVLRRYMYATTVYDKAKTRAGVTVADEDKAPCFSFAPAVNYYEEPLPDQKQHIDRAAWEKRLNEVSAVFKEDPLLFDGNVSLDFKVVRSYFLNTQGAEVVQNRTYARIMLSASTKADDGMDLPLNVSYFAYDPADLPDNTRMIADARDIIRRLDLLRQAPVVDPYTGPALLSGPASGVFFHEIFGHRIEGFRLKSGGQTFKKMVGEQVLPADFQVYCDPTLRSYAGEKMNGFYLYDDEGVKSRRVDVVVDGTLREFLMSCMPIEGFPHSNGHGRTAGGGDPVTRQSNLVIETRKPYTGQQLRQMLIDEAKKQGKEYGYYFKEVTSGFTFTGEGGSLNSFNVTPLEVYRVYTDGRPDQLVRGVDMIGTPLSMFSNIEAAGNEPCVFTGMCGAESGWVPVTASSPIIMVNKIETQRRQKSSDLPPILPVPGHSIQK